MGIAVQQPTSTMAAAIGLANETVVEGGEELFLSGEVMDGEMPEQRGGLPGSEGKHYTFMPQDQMVFSQKFSALFSEVRQPQEQRTFDAKGEVFHVVLHEKPNQTRIKELQVQKSEKPTIDVKKDDVQRFSHTKVDQAARKSLEAPKQHSPVMLHMTRGKTEIAPAKAPVEQRKPCTEKKLEQGRHALGKSEAQRQEKTQVREQQSRQHVENQIAREQEKTDDRQEEQKRRDDQEEGFAEDERHQKREDDLDKRKNFKVGDTEKAGGGLKEFFAYAAEESVLLSELFNMRVNHFDVLTLFIEVLKLSLKGREQERISRMQERQLQLEHIQNMVDNFKQQGKWMLFSNLGSGILAIISGASPIIGHMKGDWILDKLGGIFNSLREMEKDKFFKGVTKMTFAMSEMYKSTGQIQNTFAESSRTFDQHMAEMRKTDWEEDTRSMEELKDQWKNIESFLHQSLQMYHDAIRQLYN